MFRHAMLCKTDPYRHLKRVTTAPPSTHTLDTQLGPAAQNHETTPIAKEATHVEMRPR
jgi:hypothetical protein